MAVKAPKLTEKQRRFVEAYMGEAAGNGTEAARLAGYKGSAKTLGVVATENLAKPSVRAAIDARVAADPKIATRQQRQEFWTKVMLGEEDAEMRDRLKASELLGKSQADFVEKHEHRHAGAIHTMTSPFDLTKLEHDELAELRRITDKAANASRD